MLAINDVSIDLGQFVLNHVTLEVERGDYVCLVGPTGAGKTILFECVMGLQIPPTGRVTLDGRDITRLPPEDRGVGYVPQDYALFPHMNVFDNMAYGLIEHRVPAQEIRRRVGEVAKLLNIDHLLERRPSTLSGGEAQRTALGRALVLERELILMDEPFGALDQVTKRQLFKYLKAIHAELGLTVMHVTHDFGEAFGLATKVAVLLGGRLCQVGSVEDVFLRPATREVATFLGITNVWSRQDLLGCPESVVSRATLAVLDSSEECILACLPPDSITVLWDGQQPPDGAVQGPAVIQGLRWQGSQCELELDAGLPVVATNAARAVASMGVTVGDTITVALHPMDVHPMKR
ncbi:MAG: ATP-binding cassette domain-containing protein [Armatimonadetes bacterium]|jgi:ABC-type Fe3+/spermidine/putrescine transport system ATPase subunit|nr:ATP-binding cassette domain-containing protein [Armatimonadota bacterium]